MSITVFLLAILSAALINNVILTKFLGICPFLGVSNKLEGAIGMSGAVTFVLLISSIVTWLLYNFILVPLEITYMSTISFILIIAALVQLVELILKKYSVKLYELLGVYLPLITTNCVILGVANESVAGNYGFMQNLANALGSGIGFGLIIITFSAVRVKLDNKAVPAAFSGVPISLIVAAFMALAFSGLGGVL